MASSLGSESMQSASDAPQRVLIATQLETVARWHGARLDQVAAPLPTYKGVLSPSVISKMKLKGASAAAFAQLTAASAAQNLPVPEEELIAAAYALGSDSPSTLADLSPNARTLLGQMLTTPALQSKVHLNDGGAADFLHQDGLTDSLKDAQRMSKDPLMASHPTLGSVPQKRNAQLSPSEREALLKTETEFNTTMHRSRGIERVGRIKDREMLMEEQRRKTAPKVVKMSEEELPSVSRSRGGFAEPPIKIEQGSTPEPQQLKKIQPEKAKLITPKVEQSQIMVKPEKPPRKPRQKDSQDPSIDM